jgi:hypothetical protein
MTTTVGDTRVSTFEQLLDLQQDALTAAGCKKIVTDTASGGRSDRPGLQQALDYVRAGDVLVVWRLDRLGRSLKYLIEIITSLNERGIGFKSLTEQINMTTSGRPFDAVVLDRVRGYHGTEEYKKAMRKRKVWIEPLFGEAKQWHGMRRFRLCGLPKVNMEGVFSAAGQNLKRLLSAKGWGRRPWPDGAAGCASLGVESCFPPT